MKAHAIMVLLAIVPGLLATGTNDHFFHNRKRYNGLYGFMDKKQSQQNDLIDDNSALPLDDPALVDINSLPSATPGIIILNTATVTVTETPLYKYVPAECTYPPDIYGFFGSNEEPNQQEDTDEEDEKGQPIDYNIYYYDDLYYYTDSNGEYNNYYILDNKDYKGGPVDYNSLESAYYLNNRGEGYYNWYYYNYGYGGPPAEEEYYGSSVTASYDNDGHYDEDEENHITYSSSSMESITDTVTAV
jgi:hypothetical protein